MSHNLLLNANFHEHLLELDREAMLKAIEQGCPHCEGPLHQAPFPRIGFGIPVSMRMYYQQRYSLCCGHCRRRTTPPSVRFLGSRRYVAFALILVCSQTVAPSKRRLDRLLVRFGLRLSLATWKRWRAWWSEQFPLTACWCELRGFFNLNLEPRTLPGSLLRAFCDEGLVRLLRSISPLSVPVP